MPSGWDLWLQRLPYLWTFLKTCFMCIKRLFFREPKSSILSVLTSTCPALESVRAFSASSWFHFHSCHKEEKRELPLIPALWRFESLPFKSWTIPSTCLFWHRAEDGRLGGRHMAKHLHVTLCHAGAACTPSHAEIWAGSPGPKVDRKKPFGSGSPVHGVLWIVTINLEMFQESTLIELNCHPARSMTNKSLLLH